MVISQCRAKKFFFPTRNSENEKRAIKILKMSKEAFFELGKFFYNDNVIINQKDTYIIDKTGDDEKKILLFRFL